ncbi:MAG: MBL fold metallo-hydrolase [Dehalococcoidia bacterium]|nr:MBL fold metallo-hydrolase [Dehalococcoidia bacterium]
MILKSLVVGPVATNCYIVGSESSKRGIIIDPGAQAKLILKTVDDLGLKIPLIVVTHLHFDHVGALAAVKERTEAKFALHETEAGAGLGIFSRMLSSMMGGSFNQTPTPDRLLKDGDTIDIDGLHFTVLDTPGHSPGGISLYGHGIVFSGDSLFNYGIGRTDFPGCSHEKLMDSIQNKLMTLPDETIVYPGHGPSTTIGEERRGNPFLT